MNASQMDQPYHKFHSSGDRVLLKTRNVEDGCHRRTVPGRSRCRCFLSRIWFSRTFVCLRGCGGVVIGRRCSQRLYKDRALRDGGTNKDDLNCDGWNLVQKGARSQQQESISKIPIYAFPQFYRRSRSGFTCSVFVTQHTATLEVARTFADGWAVCPRASRRLIGSCGPGHSTHHTSQSA